MATSSLATGSAVPSSSPPERRSAGTAGVSAPAATASSVGPGRLANEASQPLEPAPSVTMPALSGNFRDWLAGMEDAPFLMQYHDALLRSLILSISLVICTFEGASLMRDSLK